MAKPGRQFLEQRTPTRPAGHRANTIQFPARDITRLRAVFTHAKRGFTGLTRSRSVGRRHVALPGSAGKAGQPRLQSNRRWISESDSVVLRRLRRGEERDGWTDYLTSRIR